MSGYTPILSDEGLSLDAITDLFESGLIPTDNYRNPAGSNDFPSDFSIDNYNLIILPFSASFEEITPTYDTELGPTPISAWLKSGQKRLFIIGEWTPDFDTGNNVVNAYLLALGSAMQIVEDGNPGAVAQSPPAGYDDGVVTPFNVHYLTSGLVQGWFNNLSSTISGGISLVTAIAGTNPFFTSGTFPSVDSLMIEQPYAGIKSEILVSGDINCLTSLEYIPTPGELPDTPVFGGNPDDTATTLLSDNEAFLLRLTTMGVR